MFPSVQHETGSWGERLAAGHLRRKAGFSIVARNWRNPRDLREEIDLVGRDGEALVFVEVKTRSAASLVPGFYAVDRRKRKVLRRAIRSYLRLLRHKPRTFRFDVVEIEVAAAGPVIRHFENVGLFSRHFHA